MALVTLTNMTFLKTGDESMKFYKRSSEEFEETDCCSFKIAYHIFRPVIFDCFRSIHVVLEKLEENLKL